MAVEHKETGSRAKALTWLAIGILASTALILVLVAFGNQPGLAPWLTPLLAAAGIVFRLKAATREFAFTAWVLAFVAWAMVWPAAFSRWMGYDLRLLIVPLVQVIMFGMGTKLSGQDFVRVLLMPKPVLIGVCLHFGVMPVAGYAIARVFGFPPEIAAGVVLVGSVSSGVASNVIVYLAGGNVALAVTITACSTLVSPIMTPFLMKTLAARMVPIDFFAMMMEMLSMVIAPVVAGLVAHKVLYSQGPRWRRVGPLLILAAGSFALATAIHLAPARYAGAFSALTRGLVMALCLVGLVAVLKLVVINWLAGPADWMDRALPFISMAGICVIIGIITARSRDRLLTVGLSIIVAAMLHNGLGYLLGYWLARALRLNETTCRTISVEVGMQNGGMATGLAMSVLQSADAALAPAIFGTWMNISGSVLASWWRRRPVPQEPTALGSSPIRELRPEQKATR